ncbi:hypothetical protein CIPAW_03G271900 [Carya illinoinensis]|uniref:Uncharacterized protein n=1 Tax=Carya illinoinensis TaxID=32201 RepID=A0A8T1R7Q5_CARIL|nr:hypothetical protein CIPAW_03G271900 [Carya illinoinensis]
MIPGRGGNAGSACIPVVVPQQLLCQQDVISTSNRINISSCSVVQCAWHPKLNHIRQNLLFSTSCFTFIKRSAKSKVSARERIEGFKQVPQA